MMTMEELQKACETLAEAWNKVLEPMEKLAKDLSEASDVCMLLRKRIVKFAPVGSLNL